MKSLESDWKRFIRGDKEVFREIYLYFYPNLYAYGLSISKNKDLIDNAIQDLFVRLWNQPPKRVQSIKGYILVSFRRQLIRSIRNSNEFSIQNTKLSRDNTIERSPEEKLIESESEYVIRKEIRQALETLPSRRREAIYLKFYKDMTAKEISDIMGIREEMVRNYIYKGIKSLRKNYSDHLFLLYSTQSIAIILLLSKMLTSNWSIG